MLCDSHLDGPATKAPPLSSPDRDETPGMPKRVDSRDPDLQRFAQDLELQRRSRYTIKHYGQVVHRFQTWLSTQRGRAVPLRAATPADLKQYQIHLTTQRNHRKTTLYATVKALQAFYRHLGADAADELKAPRRGQSLPKYLTESEAHRLRDATQDLPRDHAIVTLLLYTGLRVGELCRLAVSSLDFQERTLRIHSGKGDKDRLVVTSPACMDAVRAWLPHRGASGTDYLFLSRNGRSFIPERAVQRLVQKAALRAGLEKVVTPHVLRHTLATTLLRRGADIRFIQRILGHASIATTQVYTHLDDAELKRMYERAKPEF